MPRQMVVGTTPEASSAAVARKVTKSSPRSIETSTPSMRSRPASPPPRLRPGSGPSWSTVERLVVAHCGLLGGRSRGVVDRHDRCANELQPRRVAKSARITGVVAQPDPQARTGRRRRSRQEAAPSGSASRHCRAARGRRRRGWRPCPGAARPSGSRRCSARRRWRRGTRRRPAGRRPGRGLGHAARRCREPVPHGQVGGQPHDLALVGGASRRRRGRAACSAVSSLRPRRGAAGGRRRRRRAVNRVDEVDGDRCERLEQGPHPPPRRPARWPRR